MDLESLKKESAEYIYSQTTPFNKVSSEIHDKIWDRLNKNRYFTLSEVDVVASELKESLPLCDKKQSIISILTFMTHNKYGCLEFTPEDKIGKKLGISKYVDAIRKFYKGDKSKSPEIIVKWSLK